MSFFRVQPGLVTARKTTRLARLLGIDRHAVVRRVVAFWAWRLDKAPDGRLTDVTSEPTSARIRASVDVASGPIAFLDLAPLTGLFSTPMSRTYMRTGYLWGEGDAQRMRRSVWPRWPIGGRDRVLQWPYQTRRVPIYTTSNPLGDQLA